MQGAVVASASALQARLGTISIAHNASSVLMRRLKPQAPIGDITEERLDLLRECDEILLEEIVSANLYRTTSQVFAVLLPIQSVGVMGDGRSYESVVALRSVETQDFMTADWSRLPYEVLAEVSSRISNEVKGINRVVYDISSKPPATIEWE